MLLTHSVSPGNDNNSERKLVTLMRVVAFPLYATVDTSFGTDLEIVERRLQEGDDVTVVTCDKDLS